MTNSWFIVEGKAEVKQTTIPVFAGMGFSNDARIFNETLRAMADNSSYYPDAAAHTAASSVAPKAPVKATTRRSRRTALPTQPTVAQVAAVTTDTDPAPRKMLSAGDADLILAARIADGVTLPVE